MGRKGNRIMVMHVQQSLSGFLASEPQLTYTRSGEARFYATVGQEHYERNPDGSFTQLDTTFHNLVIYRRTAELAIDRFAKGDKFIAEGYVNTYEYEVNGETVPSEEFIAKRIGHDSARHRYSVDRTRRAQAADMTQAAGREGVSGPEAGQEAGAAVADAVADAQPATTRQSRSRTGAGTTASGRQLASIAPSTPPASAGGAAVGM